MARPKPLHDPQVLRAIAHPVRNRILTELDARGSLRAADLARELDIPANQASFHLRQLAKYGLVEEDPAAARDKRDRVWRATEEGGFDVSLSEMEKQPGGKAASRGLPRRTKAAWGHPPSSTRRTARTATTGTQRHRHRAGAPADQGGGARSWPSELGDADRRAGGAHPRRRRRRTACTYLVFAVAPAVPRPRAGAD